MFSFTKNYLRIIDFLNIIYMDDKMINIRFKNFTIKIQGSDLKITLFGFKEILIKGTINNIEFY